jgi:hypothetical protein
MILAWKLHLSGKRGGEKPSPCKFGTSIGKPNPRGPYMSGFGGRCDGLRCKPFERLPASGGFLQQGPVRFHITTAADLSSIQ